MQAITIEGKNISSGKISKIKKKIGMDEIDLETAHAGDIISIAGLDATVSNTVTTPTVFDPIHAIPIDPPMLSMNLTFNDSPY